MSTAASVGSDPRIQRVRVTRDQIIADLVDGRVISVPLAWSWRLSEATPAQRANFRLIGTGQGVHWPDVDEDISVEGLLYGTPAHRPKTRAHAGRVRAAGTPSKRMRGTPVGDIAASAADSAVAEPNESLQRTGKQRPPLNARR
jgi:hypothetical protein